MIKLSLVCDGCGAIIAEGISANAIRHEAQALYRRHDSKDLCLGARRFHCPGERAIAKSKTPLEGRGSASWQQMIAGLSPALINRRSVSSSCRQTPQQQGQRYMHSSVPGDRRSSHSTRRTPPIVGEAGFRTRDTGGLSSRGCGPRSLQP